jgi:hypothetical protein
MSTGSIPQPRIPHCQFFSSKDAELDQESIDILRQVVHDANRNKPRSEHRQESDGEAGRHRALTRRLQDAGFDGGQHRTRSSAENTTLIHRLPVSGPVDCFSFWSLKSSRRAAISCSRSRG